MKYPDPIKRLKQIHHQQRLKAQEQHVKGQRSKRELALRLWEMWQRGDADNCPEWAIRALHDHPEARNHPANIIARAEAGKQKAITK